MITELDISAATDSATERYQAAIWGDYLDVGLSISLRDRLLIRSSFLRRACTRATAMNSSTGTLEMICLGWVHHLLVHYSARAVTPSLLHTKLQLAFSTTPMAMPNSARQHSVLAHAQSSPTAVLVLQALQLRRPLERALRQHLQPQPPPLRLLRRPSMASGEFMFNSALLLNSECRSLLPRNSGGTGWTGPIVCTSGST